MTVLKPPSSHACLVEATPETVEKGGRPNLGSNEHATEAARVNALFEF